ncbi:MAG: transposase [Armatimonadetes bacterium]|nr:transposase [Armatimonadota bacterium]
MPKSHPPYPQEFKDEAVRLVLFGESSLAQVARNLGVSSNALADWKKAYLKAHETELKDPNNPDSLEAELARLRKENRRLRLERDILQKTVGIFSKEPREDSTL